MTTMREKLSRAVYDFLDAANNEGGGPAGLGFDMEHPEISVGVTVDIGALLDAIITTLREPDANAIKVGGAAIGPLDPWSSEGAEYDQSASASFVAMIDHLRSGK